MSNDLPICTYGMSCYRKNPVHFQQFAHPPGHPGPATSPATIDLTSDAPAPAPVTTTVSRFFGQAGNGAPKPRPRASPTPPASAMEKPPTPPATKPKAKANKRKADAEPATKRKKVATKKPPATKVKMTPAKKKKAAAPAKAPSAVNLNPEIHAMLIEFGRIERATGDATRSSVYFRAAKAIAEHDVKITSGKQAKALKGIGPKLAAKIDELLTTGKVASLTKRQDDDDIKALRELEKVYGVGPAKAKDLIQTHKITSLAELDARQDLLDDKQKVGLKYYKEFNARIPRVETAAVEAVIKKVAADVDPELRVTLCGSYRRGLPTSGDVDVLITHPSYSSASRKSAPKPKPDQQFLAKLVEALTTLGLLTDHLANGALKYMGVFCLTPEVKAKATGTDDEPAASAAPEGGAGAGVPTAAPKLAPKLSLGLDDLDFDDDDDDMAAVVPVERLARDGGAGTGTTAKPAATLASAFEHVAEESSAPLHRRIDIRMFPVECYPCALLSFTGDDDTNKEMRRVAIEKGWKLSEYCLMNDDAVALPVDSEADVFKLLGMPWREPHQREHKRSEGASKPDADGK